MPGTTHWNSAESDCELTNDARHHSLGKPYPLPANPPSLIHVHQVFNEVVTSMYPAFSLGRILFFFFFFFCERVLAKVIEEAESESKAGTSLGSPFLSRILMCFLCRP
jgi:hypothetical protein